MIRVETPEGPIAFLGDRWIVLEDAAHRAVWILNAYLPLAPDRLDYSPEAGWAKARACLEWAQENLGVEWTSVEFTEAESVEGRVY